MKIRNYILGLLASVMVFAGCEKQEDLGPATIKTLETALTFPLDGGTQSITLKATRDWTAVVSPKDCGITVSPSSGKGSNDAQTITVSAGKNTGRNEADGDSLKCPGRRRQLQPFPQTGEKQKRDTKAHTGKASEQSGIEHAPVGIEIQSGSTENSTIGRNQRQIDPQGLIKTGSHFLHYDLNNLYQGCNNQYKDQNLQKGQIDTYPSEGKFQQMIVDQSGTERSCRHNKDHCPGHAHCRTHSPGDSEKGADPEKTGQHEIVNQGCPYS